MKGKQTLFMLLLAAGFLSGACSTEGHGEKVKTQQEAEDEFLATLAAADTSTVLALCTQCMDFLQAGETGQALGMLYSIGGDGIARPLAARQREALAARFRRFPVVRYRLEYFSFSTQGNNDVKYRIEFTPRTGGGQPGASMGFMFNPVKAGGEWVLTVKDGKQPSREAAIPLHGNAPAPSDVAVEKQPPGRSAGLAQGKNKLL